MRENQVRVAPSLGALEGEPHEVWNCTPYSKRSGSAVFFGLYDLRDYIALYRHNGRKWVLWAGSDIRNLQNNFLFNDGKLSMMSKWAQGFPDVVKDFLKSDEIEHWVENETERQAMEQMGIRITGMAPSFMGNVNDFKITYKPAKKPKVYVSTGKGRQEEYGFGVVERIAHRANAEFHLYGDEWRTKHKNVIVHGRVPKEQMNEEIAKMQAGLRLNEFDGFSEVIAKALLMGQYPISRIPYSHIDCFEDDDQLVNILNDLHNRTEPNDTIKKYRKIINNFPWV